MSLKLLVGVPSHGGSIILEGAETLLAAQALVENRGGSFWFTYYGGATISLVRNAIAAEFLRSEADLLLMLDADQAIHSSAIQRMIDLNKPVVGCLYPKRAYNWANVKPRAMAAPTDHIPTEAMEFVGYLEADDDGQVTVDNGFARAEHIGTGTMLLRREAFEQLMTHFPELQGRGFGDDAYPGLSPNWGFFNPLEREDGLPLSEDISFCRRWKGTGGEIWADVVSTTTHVGPHAFTGNYMDYWRIRQQT
jgi:hypothetical protein